MARSSRYAEKKRKSVTLKFSFDEWQRLEELAKEKGFSAPYGLIKELIYNLLIIEGDSLNRYKQELSSELIKKISNLEDDIKNIKLKIGVISKRLSEIQDALIEIRSYLILGESKRQNDRIGD